MSEWDNAPAAPTGGNYAKWENVGDSVVGLVTHVDVSGATTVKGEPCPLVIVALDSGDTVSISCSQAQLWAKMLDARPEVGDRLAVKLSGVDSRPNGHTLKEFDVEVKSAAAKAAEAPASML